MKPMDIFSRIYIASFFLHEKNCRQLTNTSEYIKNKIGLMEGILNVTEHIDTKSLPFSPILSFVFTVFVNCLQFFFYGEGALRSWLIFGDT